LAVALLYLDTSALTKLVVEEPETPALRAFLAGREGERMIAGALVRTELRRAALRFAGRADVTREQAQETAAEVTRLLRRLDLVRVGSAVLDRAGSQPPPQLRSLDASTWRRPCAWAASCAPSSSMTSAFVPRPATLGCPSRRPEVPWSRGDGPA